LVLNWQPNSPLLLCPLQLWTTHGRGCEVVEYRAIGAIAALTGALQPLVRATARLSAIRALTSARCFSARRRASPEDRRRSRRSVGRALTSPGEKPKFLVRARIGLWRGRHRHNRNNHCLAGPPAQSDRRSQNSGSSWPTRRSVRSRLQYSAASNHSEFSTLDLPAMGRIRLCRKITAKDARPRAISPCHPAIRPTAITATIMPPSLPRRRSSIRSAA